MPLAVKNVVAMRGTKPPGLAVSISQQPLEHILTSLPYWPCPTTLATERPVLVSVSTQGSANGCICATPPMLRRLNVEVQQVSGRMIDLLWGFEAMSFPRSRVEFVGDPIAFLLR